VVVVVVVVVVAVCLRDGIGRLEVESRAVNFLNISPTRTIRVPQLIKLLFRQLFFCLTSSVKRFAAK
jgi:hypothetical protein